MPTSPAAAAPQPLDVDAYDFNDRVKPATAHTAARNRESARSLGLDVEHCENPQLDFARADLVKEAGELHIANASGETVWDTAGYAFLDDGPVPDADAAGAASAPPAPDSVNASLWCYARSGRPAGVFCVVEGAIYQARGFELANLTIVRGKTGWIVQDACTTEETAAAALGALEDALGEPVRDNVSAVIISHSHFDHYGGIHAVVDADRVGPAHEGKVPIFAPAGFDVACVSENVLCGPAMRQRSMHQFGGALEAGPLGGVSTASAQHGTSGFIMPTDFITCDGPVEIDGITVDFQLVPQTEAVANMNNLYVDYRALWMADNCPATLHNLYPIRGAQIRDGAAWARYLLEAAERFADRADVLFGGHGWAWHNTAEEPQKVRERLIANAAAFKYTHDQTLLLANKGLSAKEIARRLAELPGGLARDWDTRPYYGSMQINARAVYERYLGFYDTRPTDLDALDEGEEAEFFVEYAGGADAVLSRAVGDFGRGDYRRSANAACRLVTADPGNTRARQLLADAYEQLGYAAESGIWRNAFLQEARELRGATHVRTAGGYERQHELDVCMPTSLVLDWLGVLIDADAWRGEDFSFILTVTDGDGREGDGPKSWRVDVRSGVLLCAETARGERQEGLGYARLSREELFAWAEGRLADVAGAVESDVLDELLTLVPASLS